MKEYRIPRYSQYVKLFAYDSVTREVFLTYRLEGEKDFHTDKIQRVDEDRLSEMLVTLRSYSQKDLMDRERLESLTKGLPRIRASYALTSVEGCVDDADEVVEKKPISIEKRSLPVFPSRKRKKQSESSEDSAEVIQPMLEIPVNINIPRRDLRGLPMYLWDCIFRVTMGGKAVSLPMFILADSVSELEAVLVRYIDGGMFPSKFDIKSPVLVSARVVASTVFNEAFPMCLDSRMDVLSNKTIC